ncbi:Purine ribonucleoside efflux pump NepI [Nonomuraea coxensis DSM 45129]|uniref:Purine ribonucleoside efflux pump NepI n=2 Tax=Nonomuraea coxensis TaxID=404386 RepID=A0ABX8U520_9ACTN|nr:Purine ribonucleoside efflux pump NepI [Nonomuraea coxensis DSM 45129]
MLCVLMAVPTVADVPAAVAASYWVRLISRVLAGLTIGGFWSMRAGLAGRLMPPYAVGTATAAIFSAVPLGSVLGAPAGTFAVLLAYGIAGIAGNFLAGRATAPRLRAAPVTCGCLIAATTLLLPPAGRAPITARPSPRWPPPTT